MNLEHICKKIEEILNLGYTEGTTQKTNPTDFYYKVETTGFHLDHIMDKKIGKNFIPVFISSMGGNMNPVPDLKQGNYNIPIVFYFPIRFKSEIFKLYDFLVDAFVGKTIDFGENNAHFKCVCNLSVPRYGEIQELDLKQFATWVENRFQEQLEDNNQPYLSMEVVLYLTNAADGFIYGNDVAITMSIDGESEIEEEPMVFVSSSLQSVSQSLSEQELGESEAEGLPTTTATGVSFAAYYKDDDFFHKIIDAWFSGDTQSLRLIAKLTLGDYTYTRYAYVESLNMPIRKGELLSITFTLAKAIDFRPATPTTPTPSEE